MVVFYKSPATAEEGWILIDKHNQKKTQEHEEQVKEQRKRRPRTVTFSAPNEVTETHTYVYPDTTDKDACFYCRRDR